MPKQKIASAELRQQRLKERNSLNQKKSAPPGEIYLCVLGNGANGCPRSLYMFSDHTRYLFNCGEGTQRLAHEYKMKMSKLEHIFITHKSWKNLGGLLGLSLTIQDIGVPQITLHGPPNIENLYKLTKSFVMTKDLIIDKRPHEGTIFSDNCVQIQYVPIQSSSDNKKSAISSLNGDNEASQAQKKLKVSAESQTDICVSYICKCHNKPGHLVMEKCKEFGVPFGPLLGELKNGNDVTLPSGKIVYSKDVISLEEKSPIFIIVECPSEDYLENFVNESEFLNYFESTGLIVHFTPSNIMRTEQYQNWMSSFGSKTCHIILNEDCPTLNSMAIHRVQHMLNLIHPNIFSLLHEREGTNMNYQNCEAIHPKIMFKYELRPHNGVNRNSCVAIDSQILDQEARQIPGFENSLEVLQKSLRENLQIHEDKYPEVVFLGTGSCIPSKIRNVSCILLNINSKCSIFMDCGEGSYNQLLKLYGEENTGDILTNVSCIFISHMHADHHLGLFTLLNERKSAFDASDRPHSTVLILAPECIGRWLDNYSENFESLQYKFIDNSALRINDKTITISSENELIEACSNVKLTTVPVLHCPNAYGLVLELGWKIIYSGDTIPCQQLVDAGENCTLLIHEATMEDDLADEAKLKMHSTTSQAIDIAQRMKVQHTILTHFSQRYAKIPLFSEHFRNNIGCAFDNMKVQFSHLPIIPLFRPVLETLFAEHVEKLQERGIKRKNQNLNKLMTESNV